MPWNHNRIIARAGRAGSERHCSLLLLGSRGLLCYRQLKSNAADHRRTPLAEQRVRVVAPHLGAVIPTPAHGRTSWNSSGAPQYLLRATMWSGLFWALLVRTVSTSICQEPFVSMTIEVVIFLSLEGQQIEIHQRPGWSMQVLPLEVQSRASKGKGAGDLPGALLSVCFADAHRHLAHFLQLSCLAVAAGRHRRHIACQLSLAHDEGITQRVRGIASLMGTQSHSCSHNLKYWARKRIHSLSLALASPYLRLTSALPYKLVTYP